MNIHIRKQSLITMIWEEGEVVWTYSFRFLIREDASLSTSCEITVNFERVPGTSLVRINPIFTWIHEREEKRRKNQHGEGRTVGTSATVLPGMFRLCHRLLFICIFLKTDYVLIPHNTVAPYRNCYFSSYIPVPRIE